MFARTGSTNNGINTSYGLVRDANQEINDPNQKTVSKSFIQQRVERLYGPAAMSQGLYSPKKVRTSDEHFKSTTMMTTTSSTTTKTVLVEKSQNSTNTTFQSTKYVMEAQRNGHINSLQSDRKINEENINLDTLNEALPVLRHLRPEFRAQLPTLSPKRTIAISKLNSPSLQAATAATPPPPPTTTTVGTEVVAASVRNTNTSPPYKNGTTNGKLSESGNNDTTSGRIDKQATNGIRASAGANDEFNQSANQHAQQQQQPHDNGTIYQNALNSSSSSSNAVTKVTLENGRLTSNKSHDIESDVNTLSHTESIHKVHTIESKANVTNQLNATNKMDITEVDNSAVIGEQMFSRKMSNASDSIGIACESHAKADVPSNESTTTTKIVPNANAVDANGNLNKTEQKKDALYFLKTVQSERDRLIALAVGVEAELEHLLQVRTNRSECFDKFSQSIE